MVKVKSWLFTEVRGKVKKAEFRRRKNKVTELSQKRIPFNPRTPAQREVRRTYGECVEEWNKLSESEKREWRIIGTLQGISGYNAFMRDCITKKLGAVWYEILIDNTGNPNALSDFQVLLEVTNDEAFFKDADWKQEVLEFYDADKATLLNHYTELWDTLHCNAKIWIKVPYIPANECRFIYLKMNTKRTTDLSDPDATLEFYDDFSAGLSKWTTYKSGAGNDPTIEDEKAKLEVPVTGGSGVADIGESGIYKTITDSSYAIRFNIKTYYNKTDRICGAKSPDKDDFAELLYYDGTNWNVITCYNEPSETSKEETFTGQGFKFRVKRYYADHQVVMWIDNVIVVKHTSPEPTVSYAKA